MHSVEHVSRMRNFADIAEVKAIQHLNEHAGVGPVWYRRVLSRSDFETAVDFIDYTIIPPGSSIGRHSHQGNEEFYFVVNGNPLITAQGETRRCNPGALAIARNGGWHELINDTDDEVRILVVQVNL